MDFHLHSEWSGDSNVPLRDRVLSCAAEGIEYAVATDHDVITDYGPFVLPSLKDAIRVGIGVETSTLAYGHFNSWPHEMNPNLPGRGSPVWFGLELPDLFAVLGPDVPGRVVQVNHGRGGSSLFDSVGYDPADPDPEHLAQFTFNAMELINSGGGGYDELLLDWFSLLNNGLQVTATGTSDSHSIGALCGNARTYVEVADDNVKTVVLTDINDAVRAGRTLVSAGPFMTMVNVGAGVVHVRVAGPSWMPIETLQLYVDGQPDVTIDIPPYDANTVRFDADVTLDNSAGSWAVAIVTASSTPGPILTKSVRAISPRVTLD